MPYEWLRDPYWLSAALWTADLAKRFSYVLTPYDFTGTALPSLPLEFSHLLSPTDCVVVMAMDDLDRLSLDWIRRIRSFHLVKANGVFVALTLSEANESGRNEEHGDVLNYLYAKADRIMEGQFVRQNCIDPRLSDTTIEGDYVLLVCASQTDNAGDTLIAAEAAKLIRESWPGLSVVVSSPAIDRTLVAKASAVLIGPGGFLYDQHDGQAALNLQNLANYFRFGYLAHEYDKPFYLLGVGHQGVTSKIGAQFVKHSCSRAVLITCRDRETLAVLSALGPLGCPMMTHDDFSLRAAARIAAQPLARHSPRTVTLCGNFDTATPEILNVVEAVGDIRLQFVAQASEDLHWYERQRPRLERVFGSIALQDVRAAGMDEFIEVVLSSDAVVTTRFHTMMLALFAGIDVAVLAYPNDKRDRFFDRSKIRNMSSIIYYDDIGTEEASSRLRRVLSSGKRDTTNAFQADSDQFVRVKRALLSCNPAKSLVD